MYKKNISLIMLIVSALLFSSCWIYPDYKEYEIIDGIYYFDDYETMKSVIIPLINKSFSTWHWSGEKFDIKYDKYFGNIAANPDDYAVLIEKNYSYAVKNPKTLTAKIANSEKDITIKECYWITTKNNKGTVFFQN